MQVIRKLNNNNLLVVGALAIITIVALVLRMHNISEYKFYPDSYQNLIVALNLVQFQQVLGFLGQSGMVYPDFLGWTRPVYSFLTLIPGLFGLPLVPSAQLIAVICGVLAVPITYLLIFKIFESPVSGLAGAALVALSANHVVWGGFILTETPGVLFSLLFLLSFFTALKANPDLVQWPMFVAGATFGIATLARYEYAVLVAPATWLVLQRTGGWRQVGYFFVGLIFVLAACSWLFRGTFQNIFQVTEQLTPFSILLLAAAVVAFVIGLLVWRFNALVRKVLPFMLIGFVWLFAVAVIARVLWGVESSAIELTAWADFFRLDFLIGGFGLIGLTAMLRRPSQFNLAVFIITSMVLLALVYYRVNPAMQRYITHELPLLVIPAAFGLRTTGSWLINLTKIRSFMFGVILLGILIGVQTAVSYHGIRAWAGGIWYQTGYEERSANYLASHLNDEPVLIVSLPEPYYLFTKRSTHSLTQEHPYLYMPNVRSDASMVIVQDEGMRRLFPAFSKFLDVKLQDHKTDEYWTGVPFRYQANIYPEQEPVEIYEVNLTVLKDEIYKSQP